MAIINEKFYLDSLNRKSTSRSLAFYGFLVLFIAFVSACQCEIPNDPVDPVDTTPPTIINRAFSITGTARINSLVGMVIANDNVEVTSYSITAGNTNGGATNAVFAINTTNGSLTTAAAIDYEATSNYRLIVEVADASGNTATGIITINVTDVDISAPTLTNHAFSITGTARTNILVGMVIASDDVGIIFYSITAGNTNGGATNAVFAINTTNGSLTTAAAIDYEATSNYRLIVEVGDASSNTATGTITIKITDVDVTAPIVTNHAFSVIENASNDTVVGMVNASDDVRISFYSITDGNTSDAFTINNNGQITTASSLNYWLKSSNYSLTVQVGDAVNNTSSATITVNVIDFLEWTNKYGHITNTLNITNDQNINVLASNTIIAALKAKMFIWLDASVPSLFSLNTNGRLTNWVNRKDYQISATNTNFYISVTTNTNTEMIDGERFNITNVIYSKITATTYSLSSVVSAKPKSDIAGNNSLSVSNGTNGYVTLSYTGKARVGFVIDTSSMGNSDNIAAFYLVTEQIGGNYLWYPVFGYSNLEESNRFLIKQTNVASYLPKNGANGKGNIVLGESTWKRNQAFAVPSGVHLLSRRDLNISKSELNGVLGSFPINDALGGGQQVRELIIFTNTVSDAEHSNVVKYLFDKWNIPREAVVTNLSSYYSHANNNVITNAIDGYVNAYFQGHQSPQNAFVSNRVIFEYRPYGSVLSPASLLPLVFGLSTDTSSIQLITGQNINSEAIKAPFRVEILRTNDFEWHTLTNVMADTNNGPKNYYFYLLHQSNDYFGYRLVANGPALNVSSWFTIDDLLPSTVSFNSPRIFSFTNALLNNKIYQTNTTIFLNGFTNYLYFDQNVYGLGGNDFALINGTLVSLTAISDNSNYALHVRPHNFYVAANTNTNTVIQSHNFTISLGEAAITNVAGDPNNAINLFFTFVPNNPFSAFDVGGNSTPAFVDLDDDGDMDMVSGNLNGFFNFYRNNGDGTYGIQGGNNNPLNGIDVGENSTPTFGDLDGDGDLDMVSGEKVGGFLFYRNTGSATNASFSKQTGSANPLNGFMVMGYSVPGLRVGYSTPTFVDLDGDRDLDIVSGEILRVVYFYQNTGNETNASFSEQNNNNNPFNGFDLGALSASTFFDFDEDGDMDMVSGNNGGIFRFYQNTGNATNASFSEQTGSANPLNGIDVGGDSTPTFVDLDGDGDPDFLSGASDGRFYFFMNIGGVFVRAE